MDYLKIRDFIFAFIFVMLVENNPVGSNRLGIVHVKDLLMKCIRFWRIFISPFKKMYQVLENFFAGKRASIEYDESKLNFWILSAD